MDDTAPLASTPAAAASTQQVVPHRGYVLVCLMLALFMAAVEATVVATAMPRIVGALGGFALYSWVFSAFLLPQAITAILYGKLADLYGRRPMLVFGVLLFLGGSIACGFAWSMPALIVFRLIQGFGAGAILPIATTIAGDIYTQEERMRVQGYLSSVWGFAAIIGPLVGGVIVQTLSWRWIFWINVPFGILTVIGLLVYYREKVKHRAAKLDIAGAAYFTVSVTALLLLLIQGGHAWAWNSAPVYALIGACLICLALFLWQENRAPEPILSLSLWRQRLVAIANAATMIAGMGIIGVSALIPTYVQGVMGDSAIVAGFSVTALSIAWSIASGVFGRIAHYVGGRGAAQLGGLCCLLGGFVFWLLEAGWSAFFPGLGSFLFGFGMGLLTTTSTVMIQSSVDWSKRGSATASNIFSRLLGSTLGVAILGSVLNNSLEHALAGSGMGHVTLDSMREVLQSHAAGQIEPRQFAILQHALDLGLHHTFLAVMAVSALAFVMTLFLPRHAIGNY
ncbi:MAG TPA: MDR family MFS transporter [Stellaceae bacterium]|nr:MDR family MFS transporter [Stellaceae bacterium]